jgi:hypothetical protein
MLVFRYNLGAVDHKELRMPSNDTPQPPAELEPADDELGCLAMTLYGLLALGGCASAVGVFAMASCGADPEGVCRGTAGAIGVLPGTLLLILTILAAALGRRALPRPERLILIGLPSALIALEWAYIWLLAA